MKLPTEGELERVINAALNGFFQDVHQRISDALAAEVRARIDSLLTVPESAAVSGFEKLKTDPGKAGVDNLQTEIEKLTKIRAVGVGTEPFASIMSRKYDCKRPRCGMVGMMPAAIPIEVTSEQQRELQRIVTAKTSSQRDVFRARIILGLAEGLRHEEISREQGVSLLAIGRWRKRWATKGVEGLKDAPGRGASRQ